MKISVKRHLSILVIVLMCLTIVSTNLLTTHEIKAATPTYYMPIGSNFWFLGPSWTGETPMKSNINWSTAYQDGTDIWNPTFIAELKPYVNLRFMDWGGTNNSKATSWNVRRLPTDATNYEPSNNESGCLAYEWMIDLCNRTDKDLWICVPHLANDDYMTNLAKLVKEKLEPGRKFYLEYSNEVWNNQFGQSTYATAQGKAKGFQYDNSMYYTYRSFQMFKLFGDVFGSEMKTRVVRVCCFSGYLEQFGFGYGMVVGDTKLNPNKQKADLFAVAPYVGSGLDGSAANVAASFHAEVDSKVTGYLTIAKDIANQYKVPLATYEGGQHLLNKAQIFSANPQIYDEYMYMLEKFSPFLVFFNHYNHCGRAASGGAWGSKTSTGQDISLSHKYRALVDWTNSLPVPTPVPTPSPDVTKPVITIQKYVTTFTNKSITIYADTNEGYMNAYSHTFQTNGAFAFIATDLVGNVAIKIVTIKNIDKVKPKIVVKSAVGKVVANGKSVKGIAILSIIEKNLKSKTLYKSAKKVAWPTGSKLKVKGSYQIKLFDKAGNSAKFSFRVT